MTAPDLMWVWCFNEWSKGWGGYARPNNRSPLDEKERSTGAEYIRKDLYDEVVAKLDAMTSGPMLVVSGTCLGSTDNRS